MISKETEYKYARENVVELLEDFKNRLLKIKDKKDYYDALFCIIAVLNFAPNKEIKDSPVTKREVSAYLFIYKRDFKVLKKFYEMDELEYWLLINDFKDKSEHFKTITKLENF